MKRLMATVTLGGTLPEKLKAIAAAGFDGVELVEGDLKNFSGTPKDVKSIADDLGLEIAMFQPLRDFEGFPRMRWLQTLDRTEKTFDVMDELGVGLLLVCSNVAHDAIVDDDVLVEDLSGLAELARRRGIRVGYEALSWGRHVNRYRDAWRLVDSVGAENLGLVLDSFHTLCMDDDLSLLPTIPSDRIFFIQLADAPKLSLDFLQWSRRFRCFPGRGDFDLAGFLAPLMDNGYGGPLSLEIFSETYPLLPPAELALEGFHSLCGWQEMMQDRNRNAADAGR